MKNKKKLNVILNEKAKIIVICGDISLEMERKVRVFGITYLLKFPFADDEISELIKNSCF